MSVKILRSGNASVLFSLVSRAQMGACGPTLSSVMLLRTLRSTALESTDGLVGMR